MSAFKVGDRVKFLSREDWFSVVERFQFSGKTVVRLMNDDGEMFYTLPENLIGVETTKDSMQNEDCFEIGDKVVTDRLGCYYLGVITFTDFDTDGKQYFRVFVEGYGTGNFYPEDLYDTEGLKDLYDTVHEEHVKVLDEVEDDKFLVLDNYGNLDIVCGSTLEVNTESQPTKPVDSVIEELRELLKKRSETGIAKYGTTLDRTDLTPSEWCQHLLEELLDASGYVLRLKKDLEEL